MRSARLQSREDIQRGALPQDDLSACIHIPQSNGSHCEMSPSQLPVRAFLSLGSLATEGVVSLAHHSSLNVMLGTHLAKNLTKNFASLKQNRVRNTSQRAPRRLSRREDRQYRCRLIAAEPVRKYYELDTLSSMFAWARARISVILYAKSYKR